MIGGTPATAIRNLRQMLTLPDEQCCDVRRVRPVFNREPSVTAASRRRSVRTCCWSCHR